MYVTRGTASSRAAVQAPSSSSWAPACLPYLLHAEHQKYCFSQLIIRISEASVRIEKAGDWHKGGSDNLGNSTSLQSVSIIIRKPFTVSFRRSARTFVARWGQVERSMTALWAEECGLGAEKPIVVVHVPCTHWLWLRPHLGSARLRTFADAVCPTLPLYAHHARFPSTPIGAPR